MWRTSCVSHANACTSKRWNSETRPARPLGVVHVDRVDADRPTGRARGARAATSIVRAARRVHELDAPARPRSATELVERRASRPRGARARRARRATSSSAVRPPRLLHVDRELEVGPELGVHVGQPGHAELGELRGRRRRPRGAGAGPPRTGRRGRARPRRRRSARRRSRGPVAPSSSARRNAGSVFSGASSRAPRWAKVIDRHARRHRCHAPENPRSVTRPAREPQAPADGCRRVDHTCQGGRAEHETRDG